MSVSPPSLLHHPPSFLSLYIFFCHHSPPLLLDTPPLPSLSLHFSSPSSLFVSLSSLLPPLLCPLLLPPSPYIPPSLIILSLLTPAAVLCIYLMAGHLPLHISACKFDYFSLCVVTAMVSWLNLALITRSAWTPSQPASQSVWQTSWLASWVLDVSTNTHVTRSHILN